MARDNLLNYPRQLIIDLVNRDNKMNLTLSEVDIRNPVVLPDDSNRTAVELHFRDADEPPVGITYYRIDLSLLFSKVGIWVKNRNVDVGEDRLPVVNAKLSAEIARRFGFMPHDGLYSYYIEDGELFIEPTAENLVYKGRAFIQFGGNYEGGINEAAVRVERVADNKRSAWAALRPQHYRGEVRNGFKSPWILYRDVIYEQTDADSKEWSSDRFAQYGGMIVSFPKGVAPKDDIYSLYIQLKQGSDFNGNKSTDVGLEGYSSHFTSGVRVEIRGIPSYGIILPCPIDETRDYYYRHDVKPTMTDKVREWIANAFKFTGPK